MLVWGSIAICIILGLVILFNKILNNQHNYIKLTESSKLRYQKYYDLTNQWLQNKSRNIKIAQYLSNRNYTKIAIYGTGQMGMRLYEELKYSEIKVAYFIDRDYQKGYCAIDDIPIVTIKDIAYQEKVELIIVTPIYDFNKIETILLNNNVDGIIVSLSDIVFDV